MASKNDFVEGFKILATGVKQVRRLARPIKTLGRVGRSAYRQAKNLRRQSE